MEEGHTNDETIEAKFDVEFAFGNIFFIFNNYSARE